jgi:hypothetical protein
MIRVLSLSVLLSLSLSLLVCDAHARPGSGPTLFTPKTAPKTSRYAPPTAKTNAPQPWSNKPSFAAPWSTKRAAPPPKPVGPHGTSSGYNYLPPPGPPSGSVGEYGFFLFVALAAVVFGAAAHGWSRRRQEREWSTRLR